MSQHQPFLEMLLQLGWRVEPASEPACCDDPRYLAAPAELRALLGAHVVAINADETVWLLSAGDFGANRPDEFNADTFEQMSEAAAGGAIGDLEKIRSFWRSHLPVLLSVDGHYSYVAYCLSGRNRGTFVHGAEPEFEDVSVIASDLAGLQRWIGTVL